MVILQPTTDTTILYHIQQFDKHCLSNSVRQTTKYNNDTNIALNNLDRPKFSLSWSHYLILMRIENLDERSFYEIECNRQMWSVRQLSRQVNSSLYERLALSRDKDSVMRLAQDGLIVEKPSDIIKTPLLWNSWDLNLMLYTPKAN